MSEKAKPVNIALQGGGSHCALAWGILDSLLEDPRVRIESISATSGGAMNAVILAHGLAVGGKEGAREALYQFWKKNSAMGQIYSPVKKMPMEEFWGLAIEQSLSYSFYNLLTHTLSPYQFNPCNLNPLRDLVAESVDFERIKASNALKLFVSATNVKTGKIKVFTNEELSLDAVMASACLPLMFQAVNIGEEYFWDGGYMGNPAIFPLIYNSDCRDILILHVNPVYRDQVPVLTTEILNRINEISFNSSLMREMRAIAFVGKLIDNGWIKDEYKQKLKRVNIHAIRADMLLQRSSEASKLNSDWRFIQRLFKDGRQQGREWLNQHLDSVGKHSSIDINEYL